MVGKPFAIGNSGGPGRPKQKPFLEWCKKWTAEEAEKYILPIAQNPKHKAQMEAIKLVMAYAIGKPVDFHETNHSFERSETDGELLEQAKAIREQITRPVGAARPDQSSPSLPTA